MEESITIDHIPKGIVKIPPSKSIAHRAMICAALGDGQSIIHNIQLSEDIKATLKCIKSFGVKCKYREDTLEINGGIKPPQHKITLDCGESGSTLRFFIAIAALFSFPISLKGSKRLMERPLDDYISALEKQGVVFKREGQILNVCGRVQAGDFKLPGNVSSQYITGLLLVLPLLEEDSKIYLTTPAESKAYIDLTLSVMKSYGIKVINDKYKRFIIKGGQSYKKQEYFVEADFSSAAFFLVSGALGCDVECEGLNKDSLQGDKAILPILESCGAKLIFKADGVIKAIPGDLSEVTINVTDIPDLVPPLAVLLSFCKGISRITGAGRLRMKESDRLHALTVELNKLGAKITEGDDCLSIEGIEAFSGGEVEAHNDHRIAMAVALASIRNQGVVRLKGSASVNKSYPTFWEDFNREERRSNHE